MFIEIEIDITERDLELFKSISWIETGSYTEDAAECDTAVKDLIKLIIDAAEYTGVYKTEEVNSYETN